MPEYRHYRLDGAGNINSADWLEASDDDDAVRRVGEMKLLVSSEIWDRNRLVARIEAVKPE
ncbi:MAG: hypothetical protein ACR2JJ_01715 [Sphingomicrobium sp.]